MSGIFKKMAGAFVQFDEPAARQRDDEPRSPALDDISNDAGALLNQLGGTDAGAVPPPPAGTSPLTMVADEVFAAAGVSEGPNSARRIIKMLAGLSAFPPPQQLAMVRALDAADETWSEAAVITDARGRLAVLQKHLAVVEAEKTRKLAEVAARIQALQDEGKATVADVDAKIAELQQLRADAIAHTNQQVAEQEKERATVSSSAEGALRGMQQVMQAFSSLINFFTAGGPPPSSPA
jgi:hypothetical protein